MSYLAAVVNLDGAEKIRPPFAYTPARGGRSTVTFAGVTFVVPDHAAADKLAAVLAEVYADRIEGRAG